VSSYEDYTRTSAHYDETRVPVGVEIVLGCLARTDRPLGEQTIVDAGCGTGSYSQALLGHVARIEAIDMNEGMLGVARRKLQEALAEGRIALHRASIDALPLADADADGAMINQVLHHLPDEPAKGWPLIRRVLGELARVLRPGGALIVNISSHAQLERGAWYVSLAPEALAAMRARHVPLDDLEAMLRESGFETRGRFVPVDAVVQGEHYANPRGPLDPAWRDGDSFWSILGEAQLARALERIRALDAAGELEAFVAEQDAVRRQIGQVTFVSAVRG